jgi:hypothetical protein
MPSHADRVRRHYTDANPREEPPVTHPREALMRPLSELQRYAGWLGKDHVSAVVRSGVQALCLAIDAGNDTSLLLLTLDKDIGRLPSGDLRKMLRKALEETRALTSAGTALDAVPTKGR